MDHDQEFATPPDWVEVPLGSVADVSWGDTSTTKSSYVDSGYTAYSAKGPDGFLPYADHHRTAVVLSAIGADCGRTWLAKGDWSCIKNTIRFWSTDPNVATEFIYWATRNPGLWPKRGSAQPFISQGDARALKVSCPPIHEQRAIARILGIVEDKIELNCRASRTLEAMTRALFKSWFVDFDPVRAKMAGLDAGVPPHLTDLFPDRLVDSEVGEIPEGWRAMPLDQIADFLNGLALQKFPVLDSSNSLPVIKIGELRGGISAKSDRASREVPKKYVVEDGDFLFSWSGSLLAKFWTGGEGALNQHLFKVTSTRYPMWFCSQWIHHHLDEFQAIAASKATTMGHIQRSHLKDAITICPPERVLSQLGDTMGAMVNKNIKNELEAHTLSQIRETLLPQLISGSIRVRDVEKIA